MADSGEPITVWKGYTINDTNKWHDFSVKEITPKKFDDYDVDIAIDYCGVCGSDVHTITGGWGEIQTPLVTGHEIVGHVKAIGSKVTEFKPGQRVGVGAQVWSCGECNRCKNDQENYCPKQADTYNAKYPNGDWAHGGYATAARVHERFVFPIPDSLESNIVAPMMCAGLTVFSPLVRHGAAPGAHVGVIGIGGLGHLAIQFAKALGSKEVVAFSHSKDKEEDARKMGATQFCLTDDKEALQNRFFDFFDLIVCTTDIADKIPLDLLPTLRVNKRFIVVAMPDDKLPGFMTQDMAGNGCLIGGGHIGNKKEAIQMLKLAAEKGVKTWIEEQPMSEAGTAVQRVKNNDVRYRHVLRQDLHNWH